jgi:hypothetical protein
MKRPAWCELTKRGSGIERVGLGAIADAAGSLLSG